MKLENDYRWNRGIIGIYFSIHVIAILNILENLQKYPEIRIPKSTNSAANEFLAQLTPSKCLVEGEVVGSKPIGCTFNFTH